MDPAAGKTFCFPEIIVIKSAHRISAGHVCFHSVATELQAEPVLSMDLPQVSEWRLVTTPSVAQKDLGRHEAAVVEIGRMARGSFLDAAEPRRHLLAHGADHHRHVGDGRLRPGRLVADIIKVDLLVQRLGRVRQTCHHEVVGYTRPFVLHHLPSPPTACTATEGQRKRERD